MRVKLIALILILTSSSIFAQRDIKKDKSIQFIQLPSIPMPNVKTYACKWDGKLIEQNFPNYEIEVGINPKTIQGILNLEGYTYDESNPDVTITIIGKNIENISHEIVNISNVKGVPNFRAKYIVPADWEIKIEGKFTGTIKFDELVDKLDIYVPTRINPAVISTEARMEEIILEKEIFINSYVKNTALTLLLDITKEVVQSELCYHKKVEEVTVKTFKSNKKEDMTEWDKPFERGLDLLDKIDKGGNPIELYTEYKDIFEFWDAKFQENKGDSKKRKILEVSASNSVSLLAIINPNLVKNEYFDWLDSKMKSVVEKAQKRQNANSKNSMDYGKLKELPVLDLNSYEVIYFTSDGEQKKAVLKLTSHYGVYPSETNLNFELFDLDTYLDLKGKVTSKNKIDIKSIEAYELFGTRYDKVKYNDPTALSLGGNEAFVEVLEKGELSLYKIYVIGTEENSGLGLSALKSVVSFDMSSPKTSDPTSEMAKCRANPSYIISYKKKKTVVFNYSKLAEILKDCETVSEKIKAGGYGNEKVAEKESKLGKFIQGGLHNEIKKEHILEIVQEFNSLM